MPLQQEILAPVPPLGRFLTLGLVPGTDPRPALRRLSELPHGERLIVGIGPAIAGALSATVAGLRAFPAVSGPGTAIPSTQGALWVFMGGDDGGGLLLRSRKILSTLGAGFRIEEDILAFKYDTGRDLSGYEDGTENPKGDRALSAAIVDGNGPGLDGSSFVAAQRWLHDLGGFETLSAGERDFVIGRHHGTNEELPDAPPTAHVKRAAQESFEPEAFMLRRSMPWGGVLEHGLYFVAFGASLDPFERVLTRMVGLEDGMVDGLLKYSRPLTGGYYWCPPLTENRLDLRALGL